MTEASERLVLISNVFSLAGTAGLKEYRMPKLTDVVPPNLTRLWAAEDEMLAWATTIVASEKYLQDHLEMIEAYMDVQRQ